MAKRILTTPLNLPWREREDDLDEWGRRGWRWLHLRAVRYPATPSARRRAEELAAFWAFLTSLPCPACRAHAAAYARAHPPDLTGSLQYQMWAWAFHNAVNKRLGKAQFTVEQYRALYREDQTRALARYLE
jgi:hypothetical protein